MANGTGYIPSGGVWTAEERRAWRNGQTFDLAVEKLMRADATVSALIAALENAQRDVIIDEGDPKVAEKDARWEARKALLDSLK